MATVILSRHWKAKGPKLPKSVVAAKQRKSKARVRVGTRSAAEALVRVVRKGRKA